ncbi:MAG: hypothetical protein Q4G03_04620 [Planctomycetia bacterium]|nr:hypothetical protein [Planctomycetia bacterium]
MKNLKEAQRAVRRVDLTATFCAFLTIALAALLLGVLLDHWILSRGLSVRGRLYFAIGWVAFTLSFLIIRLIPIFRRRVTALYAAKVIEQTQEDHNNLTINWLQLCCNPDGTRKAQQSQGDVNPAVLSVVATQAASQARAHANELTLDCTVLIRWGVALTVTVAICAAYLVLSPKNSFASVGRIVAPFAEIERPQALSFRSVEPGNVTVYLGDSLDVIAEIDGVGSRTVELLYSTEDQRLIDVPIEMEALGGARYKARFPQGEEGFAENMTYRIAVGRQTRFESSSDTYAVTTRPQPSFRVEQIRLNFPKYTGWEEKVLSDQGDIVALEQTSVELRARANSQLQRAYLLPNGDVRRAIKMTIDPNSPNLATCQFNLNWKDNDRDAAVQEFSTYRVISVDVDEQENRDALDHNVTILHDLPPEIQWVFDPPQDDLWPVNHTLQIKALVQDQDYSLRAVELHFAYSELNQGDQDDSRPDPEPVKLKLRETTRVPLSSDPDGPSPYVGAQTVNYELTPEKLGLVPGDEIEYWIVAFDSMRPQANVAVSEKKRLVIEEPSQSPFEQNQEDEEQKQSEDDKPTNSNSPEQGQGQGASQNQGQGSDQNSGKQNSDDDQDSQGDQNQDGQGENSQQTDSGESNDDPSGEDSGEQSETGDDRPNGDNENNSEGGAQNQTGDSGDSQDSTGDSSEDQDSESKTEGSQTGSDDSQSSSGAEQSDSKNASDAFETLLNYLRQEENAEQGDDANDGDSQDSQEDAQGSAADVNNQSDAQRDHNDRQGSGNNSEQSQDKPQQEANQQDEEPVDPNFNSQEDLPEPTEKRNMPTRTSPDKPEDESQSYLANDPPPLDPNVRRQNGEVQPDGNNFLAQNANDDDLENATDSSGRENITADPNNPNDQRASTKPDKNAREIKGNGANPEIDENTQVDQTQPERNNQRSNNSNPNADQLGDLGSQGQNASTSDSSQSPSAERNDSAQGDEQNKGSAAGKAPGNDKENQMPEEKGGGGGSGAGEMGLGQQTLAPADAPNLQYAEKASNFVLDYLENALKDSVDPRLLNELGWSEEELRLFYEHWKKMREQALDPNNPNAKRNYLDALNELSHDFYADLDPNEPLVHLREGQMHERTNTEAMTEATRVKTPERLLERVRAFNRGVANAGAKREGAK